MVPDEKRLLSGARSALAKISTSVDPGIKATLDAVDAVLADLLLRTEHDFYHRHYADGLALAGVGSTLSGIANPLRPIADAMLATNAVWPHIDELRVLLETMVRALTVPAMKSNAKAQSWLAQIVDWENEFHSRHSKLATSAPPAKAAQADPYSCENLETYLRHKFPEWKNLSVSNIKRLAGGFSKKTTLFDVTDDVNGTRSLVIRAEQPPRFEFWDGDQVKNEFIVLQMVHEAGLPVAEPLWLETDRKVIGQHFLVSKKAEGHMVGSSIGASAAIPATILHDLIGYLVKIHNTRLDINDERLQRSHLKPWAQHKTLREATTAWVAHWLECIRKKHIRASPLTVRMMEWLRNNVPDDENPPSMLHGDFGLHNTLVNGDKVSCILDWEYLTFGDPAEDIALLAISLNGVMSKAEIMKIYVECGGHPISDYRLLYFDVIYAMKFIVPCENGLKLFQDNEETSIGLCHWGFLYPIAGVGSLNEKIALAEAARNQ